MKKKFIGLMSVMSMLLVGGCGKSTDGILDSEDITPSEYDAIYIQKCIANL